ncbi:MAG: shikimate kinase [Sphingobacteriia bacterium]|nr:MAG: shikimate kinase [Sphingobacteriia bacterium]TAH08515.1 MAG: shikimate kinase [Sphingobacteriia bacterium]
MKVFLLGMMGSGKSYWTKLLATKYKTGGYDLDSLIESLEEKTITEIFESEGEAHFRQLEADTLRWFAQKKTFILATGGGTPCFHNNMEWMNKEGLTIWIDEPIEILAGRLSAEKSHRPLLKNLTDDALIEWLQTKLSERTASYSLAQIRLQSNEISLINLTKLIDQYA